MAEALHLKTKETIEGLSDEQVLDLLRLKWIAPLCASLRAMPKDIIGQLEKAVQALANKFRHVQSHEGFVRNKTGGLSVVFQNSQITI